MQVRNFEDLEIWKDARRLAKKIYGLTLRLKFAKDFALTDQIRNAAISVTSTLPKRSAGWESGSFLKRSTQVFTAG